MFLYGMRLRGFSPGTFPGEGFIEREDDEARNYWDLLLYDRQLTEKEVKDYELDYLGEIKK